MKSFIVLLSACFLVLLLLASPVLAIDCGLGFSAGYDCCPTDRCRGDNKGQLTCVGGELCCESCAPAEEVGDGIINPVIGLFGTQKGELTLAYLLATFLRISLVAAGILLLIYLIMGGIQWLTSGGEKTAVAAARDKITNAFIGLIIIVFVIVIINLINYIFGLDILHPTLPTPE